MSIKKLNNLKKNFFLNFVLQFAYPSFAASINARRRKKGTNRLCRNKRRRNNRATLKESEDSCNSTAVPNTSTNRPGSCELKRDRLENKPSLTCASTKPYYLLFLPLDALTINPCSAETIIQVISLSCPVKTALGDANSP